MALGCRPKDAAGALHRLGLDAPLAEPQAPGASPPENTSRLKLLPGWPPVEGACASDGALKTASASAAGIASVVGHSNLPPNSSRGGIGRDVSPNLQRNETSAGGPKPSGGEGRIKCDYSRRCESVLFSIQLPEKLPEVLPSRRCVCCHRRCGRPSTLPRRHLDPRCALPRDGDRHARCPPPPLSHRPARDGSGR